MVALLLLAGTSPAVAEEAGGAQRLVRRLDWRVGELEGEVATLRRYAEQQGEALVRLEARAEAVAHQRWEEAIARFAAGLGATGLLLSGLMAWRPGRRRSPR